MPRTNSSYVPPNGRTSVKLVEISLRLSFQSNCFSFRSSVLRLRFSIAFHSDLLLLQKKKIIITITARNFVISTLSRNRVIRYFEYLRISSVKINRLTSPRKFQRKGWKCSRLMTVAAGKSCNRTLRCCTVV